ncbi:MAG: GNAT family N-acetyltransferase [Acutalibacteraceae bacterium]|nr:GNAT family N-acetyltransferase [Acutalibacteraceae bacterium]
MITSGLPSNLPNVCDIAFVKTMCAYKAYKDYPNVAKFWHQTDEKGNITAVISCINFYATLWFDGGDENEIISFFSFLNPTGIFTSKETALKLNLAINEECFVFKKEPPFETASYTEKAQPRQLLNLLKQGLTIPDGDGFVADVTFRKYHGCAYYVTQKNGGALLFTNDNTAIINGIAVKKNTRSKGVGSALIKLLLSKAENRTVFACCIEKNKNFYIKNGFTLIGEAAYCEEE